MTSRRQTQYPNTSQLIDVRHSNTQPVAQQWGGQGKQSPGGPRVPVPGTKLQRGGEVRREWNEEGALGGLSLHFCPGVSEFQVTPPHTAKSQSTYLIVSQLESIYYVLMLSMYYSLQSVQIFCSYQLYMRCSAATRCHCCRAVCHADKLALYLDE